MTSKKGLLRGNKISRSHSTLISVAEPVVARAKALPEVKKISFGIITVTKCTPGIKIAEERPGILRISVRSASAVQIIWIYLADSSASQTVTAALVDAFIN